MSGDEVEVPGPERAGQEALTAARGIEENGACCAPDEEASCCTPAAKPVCCAPTTVGGCGCR